MKKMKWILTACICMTMAISSQAQQAKQDPAQAAKALQTQLKLTDAQTTKITAIFQDIQQKQAADKATQDKIKKWQADKDMKSLFGYALQQLDAASARIEPVLTADQKKTYEAQIAQERAIFKNLLSNQQQ